MTYAQAVEQFYCNPDENHSPEAWHDFLEYLWRDDLITESQLDDFDDRYPVAA